MGRSGGEEGGAGEKGAGAGEGGAGREGEEEGELPLLQNAIPTFCWVVIWFCQINKGLKWR